MLKESAQNLLNTRDLLSHRDLITNELNRVPLIFVLVKGTGLPSINPQGSRT